MIELQALVDFCDARTGARAIKDFGGALNGLQFANRGGVSRIGAAVDAGLEPFRLAVAAKVDFLIVHHGMFWNGAKRVVDAEYEKARLLVENNLAVYACHLPLDAHPEIGNNALLAKAVGLERVGTFLDYEGLDIGLVGSWDASRDALRERLAEEFGPRIAALEFGPDKPRRVCVLTGSGASAVDRLKEAGADTFITGELHQQHFNQAQELGINVYLCGHYATETLGVRALAAEAAARFGLEWEFLPTGCPL